MTKRVTLGFAAILLGVTTAFAAGPKEYQVTGPVLDVTNDAITVEKDKEKWEIARTKDTKVTGDLKKGARVTVKYTMTAASVEVKDAGKGKTEKKEEKKK
ncbi:MAG TPA: hypothetical protein VFC14_07025 [Burkholderiales bacterium]|jgi:hypothetical protein|nr:hypothetical protein [Burkholderiales bacterium]